MMKHSTILQESIKKKGEFYKETGGDVIDMRSGSEVGVVVSKSTF